MGIGNYLRSLKNKYGRVVGLCIRHVINKKMSHRDTFYSWGPRFDAVLPEDVQQVIELSELLNEILAEISKMDVPESMPDD